MSHVEFSGPRRFDDASVWQHEMKQGIPGFAILLYHSVPQRGDDLPLVRIEYELPEGAYELYSRCTICGEFLLGRALPEESQQFAIDSRRPGQ